MRNATLSIENDNVSVESDWKITHRGQITRDFPLGRCKPFSVTTKEDIAPSGEMNIIRVTSTQKLRYSVLIPNLLALLHPLIVLKIHVNTIWWFAAHKIPSSLRPLAEPIASGVLSYDQVASLPLHQKKANRSVDTANRAYSQNTPWNTQGNGRNKAKLQDTVNVQCILSKLKV